MSMRRRHNAQGKAQVTNVTNGKNVIKTLATVFVAILTTVIMIWLVMLMLLRNY